MNSTSNNLIIGETCLLGYQLRRLNIIEGVTGIFENMLVNLDGVRSLIEDDFKSALQEKYLTNSYFLYYPDHNIGYNKWLNEKYTLDVNNIFSWPVFCYFHYDALDQSRRESICRRLERLEKILQDDNNVNLFYYYRSSTRFNLQKFLKKANDFISFLEIKYKKTFHMYLITKKDSNKIEVLAHNFSKITHYEFTSPSTWVGIDDNWNGSSDNSLFDIFKTEIMDDL